MSISRETMEKIKQFAKGQARRYLDAAEMTYMEKLRKKTGQTKQKISKAMARFKNNSDQAIEAQNDMILYMSDYMNDLIAKGMSEQQAFEKAKEELSAGGKSDFNASLHERIEQYYETLDPSEYEAVGLLYGGFAIIGVAAGALAGYIISGGRQEFLLGGWIDVLIGTCVGAVIGTGLSLICHAVVSIKRK